LENLFIIALNYHDYVTTFLRTGVVYDMNIVNHQKNIENIKYYQVLFYKKE